MSSTTHKKILDFRLFEKEEWPNSALLKLKTDEYLPEIFPGQFVQVSVLHSPSTYLRRPFSVNFVDRERSELWLLVQKVGDGSRSLAELAINSTVNMIVPLGNSFSIPNIQTDSLQQQMLLIGGGIGTAPLLFLGKTLSELGYSPNFLLGGRSCSDLLQLDEFARYGKLYTTTQDGSHGEQGLVTEHSILKEMQINRIYCCGPRPMMQAVASYAKKINCWCEVSLENLMACGFGACLCCVEKTTEGHVCTCTEGPVFNINQLLW